MPQFRVLDAKPTCAGVARHPFQRGGDRGLVLTVVTGQTSRRGDSGSGMSSVSERPVVPVPGDCIDVDRRCAGAEGAVQRDSLYYMRTASGAVGLSERSRLPIGIDI